MVSLLSPLRTALGRHSPAAERCVVCDRDIDDGTPPIRLSGGVHVHRGCSTYTMRQNDRFARRARLLPR